MNKNSSIYIDKLSSFKSRKEMVNEFIDFEKELPQNIFNENYKYYMFLEFDELFSEDFYNYFCKYVGELKLNIFTLYTLKPNPEDYFFKHFRKFSVIDFGINDNWEIFLEKLHSDPGDSPADAMMFNSNEIILFCNDLSLFIYGNREEELAIITSKDYIIFNKFIDNYPRESLMNVKDHINDLIPFKFSNASFTEKRVSFYSDLIMNYS